MLKINNLTKRFGGLAAVNDVSVEFAAGQINAIIGPNGAGKTTFFNLVAGAMPLPPPAASSSTAWTSPARRRTALPAPVSRGPSRPPSCSSSPRCWITRSSVTGTQHPNRGCGT